MQFLVMLLMLVAGVEPALPPGAHWRLLGVDGAERTHLVHVLAHYDPAAPLPVVLAFHGGGANAKNMVAFSGLNEKANQADFIVVYPEGSGRLARMLTFNAGNCCGHAAAELSDRIAAIAPVAGPRGTKDCQPGRAVSVMHFHGGADEFAPFKGGGHTWPGRDPGMRALDVSTRDISANDMMWDFFQRHPMK